MHATAFAPATVANVAVGFDLLGFAVDMLGDRVTLRKGEPGIRVVVQGLADASAIPTDPKLNTATVGLLAVIDEFGLDYGFDVHIDKGIPLGSGLGGSAASAVASIVAANHILGSPLTQKQMLRFALMGEAVASGAAHPDNAAPCLLGGFTFAHGVLEPDIVSLPLLDDVSCVLVHPHIRVDTKAARAVLPETVSLKTVVNHTAHLASFMIGLYTGDTERLFASCQDILIEPHRQALIPGFAEARAAAFAHGAKAFSISGAGPTVFALCHHDDRSQVLDAVRNAFEANGIPHDGWTTEVGCPGARIVEAT